MSHRVEITVPWRDDLNLLQDMATWLETHVGRIISPYAVNSVGENWRRVRVVAPIWGNPLMFDFEFDDPRHATLFKLTWG